jgi:hypothetical protein
VLQDYTPIKIPDGDEHTDSKLPAIKSARRMDYVKRRASCPDSTFIDELLMGTPKKGYRGMQPNHLSSDVMQRSKQQVIVQNEFGGKQTLMPS